MVIGQRKRVWDGIGPKSERGRGGGERKKMKKEKREGKGEEGGSPVI